MQKEEKKKILIISMRAGFGHLRAGDALLDYAKTNLKNINAKHIDILDLDPFFKPFLRFYEFAVKRFPKIWGIIYVAMNLKWFSFITKAFSKTNIILIRKIRKFIIEKNPDVILFTNIVPVAVFLSACKGLIDNKKIGVIVTDYHGSYFYYFKRVDYYFVVNDQVKKDLIKIGISVEKIIVSGIPVSPKFYVKQNIDELKTKFKVNNNFPIVLLIASFRFSNKKMIYLVKNLLEHKPKINLVYVANGNKKLFNVVKNKFLLEERLLLINWTNEIEEYMKIADVVISKAGGLTVSECLSLHKPMIIVNPIPGQEEYNVEFIEKNNFGKRAKNVKEIINTLSKLISQSNNNQPKLVPEENPCKKIFKYFLD